jgi:hypothetical protein
MSFEKLTEEMRKAAEDLVKVVEEFNEVPILGSGENAGRLVPSMLQEDWWERIRKTKEVLTGSNILKVLDALKKRPVDQCMIYVVFQRETDVILVRYAGPERAAKGVNTKEAEGFTTLWAIQGRRRSFESILEENDEGGRTEPAPLRTG